MQFKSLKDNDFTTLYSSGNRTNTRHFSIVYKKDPVFALGFSISSKLGNAVKRNHLRRRAREIIRHCLDGFSIGARAVIIPRSGSIALTYSELSAELMSLLRKAGIVS